MAAPVNTPTQYAGADGGFLEIALPTAQAKETDTLVHFVYKGAQHAAGASGITSTNFVITDVSGTLLPSYLVTFTAYNDMELHIRFPNVSTSTAQYVYLQWGSGITRSNDSAALTGAGFDAFWNSGIASGNMPDLTGNGHNGTATITAGVGVNYGITGKIGDAVQTGVTGASHGNFLTDWLGTGLSAVTFHCWAKMDMAGSYPMLFSYGNAANPEMRGNAGTGKPEIVDKSNNSGSKYTGSSLAGDGLFHHIVGTADGSNLQLFIDGTAYEDKVEAHTIVGTASPLKIGQRSTVTSSFPWYGSINAPRISNVKRSANYILREYNNENGFATDAVFVVSDPTPFPSGGYYDIGETGRFGINAGQLGVMVV